MNNTRRQGLGDIVEIRLEELFAPTDMAIDVFPRFSSVERNRIRTVADNRTILFVQIFDDERVFSLTIVICRDCL